MIILKQLKRKAKIAIEVSHKFNLFFIASEQIDELSKDLSEYKKKLEKLESTNNERFNKIEEKMNGINERMGNMEERFNERMGNMEDNIKGIKILLEEIKKKIF